MAKYKTVIGERVKGKIENLRDFYAEQKSGRDTDFLSNLWDCIEDLEENPFRWQYLYTKNERKIPVGSKKSSFQHIVGKQDKKRLSAGTTNSKIAFIVTYDKTDTKVFHCSHNCIR